MTVAARGTDVYVVDRFYLIDPVTGDATLADPDNVIFRVLAPDGIATAYTFGVDPEVTHPSVGLYVCKIVGPLPPGEWESEAQGIGTVDATSMPQRFTILQSGVLAPVDPGVATPGPCSSWISGDDVAACPGSDLGVGSDTFMLDDVAYDACFLLYELSGRQYPGVCTRKVRPCNQACKCFVSTSPTLAFPYYWSSVFPGGPWAWRNECGATCGCGTESYLRLGGYPVREILEIKLDGVVLDPATYAIMGNRRDVLRLSDPGPPVVNHSWPACQNLALPDSEPGTISVTYTWGTDVPSLGRSAAAALARELWLACNGGECKLPTKVTKIVRAGLTMERIVPLAEMLRSGSSGIVIVDAFLAGVNPSKITRRPAFYSPDTNQPGRVIVGQ